MGLRSRSAPRSSQVAASPCCKQALPDIISAILVQALGPLPGGDVSVLQLVASQDTAASHHKGHVRLTRQSLQQLPQGGIFPGCSHSLMFRLPDSLDLQVAPDASFEGRPGRLHHASLGWLPAPRCGIATCVNEQFTRLDFHQLDCSLVGCSPFASCPGLNPSSRRSRPSAEGLPPRVVPRAPSARICGTCGG